MECYRVWGTFRYNSRNPKYGKGTVAQKPGSQLCFLAEACNLMKGFCKSLLAPVLYHKSFCVPKGCFALCEKPRKA